MAAVVVVFFDRMFCFCFVFWLFFVFALTGFWVCCFFFIPLFLLFLCWFFFLWLNPVEIAAPGLHNEVDPQAIPARVLRSNKNHNYIAILWIEMDGLRAAHVLWVKRTTFYSGIYANCEWEDIMYLFLERKKKRKIVDININKILVTVSF